MTSEKPTGTDSEEMPGKHIVQLCCRSDSIGRTDYIATGRARLIRSST